MFMALVVVNKLSVIIAWTEQELILLVPRYGLASRSGPRVPMMQMETVEYNL